MRGLPRLMLCCAIGLHGITLIEDRDRSVRLLIALVSMRSIGDGKISARLSFAPGSLRHSQLSEALTVTLRSRLSQYVALK